MLIRSHDRNTNNDTGRINMPIHKYFPVTDIAPKAWSAMCQLLGGEDRINEYVLHLLSLEYPLPSHCHPKHQPFPPFLLLSLLLLPPSLPPSHNSQHPTPTPDQPPQLTPPSSASSWKDSFIVNLGIPSGSTSPTPPQQLTNWHVDGDFFVHYLDSPEQALLVIPLWTDIVPSGGGTVICPPGIPLIAQHLFAHPEGVSSRMTPRAQNPTFASEGADLSFYCDIARGMPDEAFVEVTGEVGDVYLLHPLMLHSASHNALRRVRVITNPPVSVKEAFNFDREDGAYSVVERKTLRALGRERLEGWRITRERERVVPGSTKVKEEMKRLEDERLERARRMREGGAVGVKGAEVGVKA